MARATEGVEQRQVRTGRNMQNITRMDYGRTHSWWVRIYRSTSATERELYNKNFTDGVWGGKQAALRAARAWRDAVLARVRPKQRPTERVAPGYGYIQRTELWRRSSYAPVWAAWMRAEDMRSEQTSYSVEKWGEAGAEAKAAAWLRDRQKQLKARLKTRKQEGRQP